MVSRSQRCSKLGFNKFINWDLETRSLFDAMIFPSLLSMLFLSIPGWSMISSNTCYLY